MAGDDLQALQRRADELASQDEWRPEAEQVNRRLVELDPTRVVAYIAAYKWLAMRLGIDTVKPDVHLHNFIEPIVGHRVTDEELVRVLEHVADQLDMRPRALDASLWEYQRGGPGSI